MRVVHLYVLLIVFVMCGASRVEASTSDECSQWPRSSLTVRGDGQFAAVLGYKSEAKRGRTSRYTQISRGLLVAVDLIGFERPDTDWADAICIVDLTGQRAAQRLDPANGATFSFATWSPDGNWLAYVVSQGGSHQIWLASADGAVNQRLDSDNVNVLVQGSTWLGPPFSWHPNSESLLFVTPESRELLSTTERLELFSKPLVLDTRPQNDSRSHIDREHSVLSYVLGGSITEVTLSGDRVLTPLPLAEGIWHLDHWDDNLVVVGLVEERPEGTKGRLYFSERADLGRADWRDNAVELPVSNPTHLFRVHSGRARIGAAIPSSGEPCLTGDKIEGVFILCLESPDLPFWLRQTPDYFVLAMSSGRVSTYDKKSGRRVWSGEMLYEKEDRFIPSTHLSHERSGSGNVLSSDLYVDQQGRILLYESRFDNGEIRAYRLSALDPSDGAHEVLLDDESNVRNIVKFGMISESGELLVIFAEDAGRFRHGTLNPTTRALTSSIVALNAKLSFSDFAHSDLSFEREDGVDLMGRVFWPGADDLGRDAKLPLLIWQYPFHYDSEPDIPGQYEQRLATRYAATSDLDYVGEWLPLRFLEAGFAVFYYPSAPLIGDDDTSGFGTFEQQMIMNAEAAVQSAVATGRIDSDRIAVAGHSRGGGDTALLLANTDLFKTGISIAGQMNAMLMTYAKQYDERPFWEDPDVYIRASASAKAHMVDEPILMIHGVEDDSNARSATSESLFNGIQKAGGTARLVLLPFMGHQVETQKERDIVTNESVAWLLHYLSPGEGSTTVGAGAPEG